MMGMIKTHVAILLSLLNDIPYPSIQRLVFTFFSFVLGCEYLDGRMYSKSIKNHGWGGGLGEGDNC